MDENTIISGSYASSEITFRLGDCIKKGGCVIIPLKVIEANGIVPKEVMLYDDLLFITSCAPGDICCYFYPSGCDQTMN